MIDQELPSSLIWCDGRTVPPLNSRINSRLRITPGESLYPHDCIPPYPSPSTTRVLSLQSSTILPNLTVATFHPKPPSLPLLTQPPLPPLPKLQAP